MGQFLFAFLIMLVVFFGWTLLVIRLGLDVYEVRKPDGKAMLFPAIADVVKVVDVSGCRMEILPQKEL